MLCFVYHVNFGNGNSKNHQTSKFPKVYLSLLCLKHTLMRTKTHVRNDTASFPYSNSYL